MITLVETGLAGNTVIIFFSDKGDFKMIWDWHGKLELFDIQHDPFEKNDLALQQPKRTQAMLKELQEWLHKSVKPQYFPFLNPDYDAKFDKLPYQFHVMWNL